MFGGTILRSQKKVTFLLFSHSVMFHSLWSHGLQLSMFPCPSLSPRAGLNSCPCHPTISSSIFPFSSCLQSFPAPWSFPMSQLFTSGGQSIGASASASVLPMNIQDWLVWSPCSPRDSQESSPISQFKNISSSVLSLLYGPTFISIHDYWKNHSFDFTNICWHSNIYLGINIFSYLRLWITLW